MSVDHQTLAKAHAKAIVHAVEHLVPHLGGDAPAGSTSTSQLNAGTKAIIGSTPSASKPFIIIVMAVSAGGKSTIGALLTHVLNSRFAALAASAPSSTESGSTASRAPSTEVEFLDADAFHSEANKKKMSQGVGLTDEDRAEWLEKCSSELDARIAKGHSVVFACSSLKKSYRRLLFAKADSLREASEQCEQPISAMETDSTAPNSSNMSSDSSASRRPNTEQYLVYLRGSFALLNERIKQRAGHFAGASLLQSQFDTLQPPSAEECAAMNVKFYTVDLDANRDFRLETDTIADWIVSDRKL